MIRKLTFLCLSACIATSLVAQPFTKTITVDVKNPTKQERKDVPVVIDLNALNLGFTVKSAVVSSQGQEVPSQLDDLTRNRKADELAFVADIPGKKSRSFPVTLASDKRAKQPELRV